MPDVLRHQLWSYKQPQNTVLTARSCSSKGIWARCTLLGLFQPFHIEDQHNHIAPVSGKRCKLDLRGHRVDRDNGHLLANEDLTPLPSNLAMITLVNGRLSRRVRRITSGNASTRLVCWFAAFHPFRCPTHYRLHNTPIDKLARATELVSTPEQPRTWFQYIHEK